jgi:hypothetical protein
LAGAPFFESAGDFVFLGCYGDAIHSIEEPAMDQKDRVYFARRAAEELDLALAATDSEAAQAHRQLQRAYLERASVGDRPAAAIEVIG